MPLLQGLRDRLAVSGLQVGTNLPIVGTANMAVATGAQWARIVGTWVYDQSDYVLSLNAAGVKVLLCLTRQSLDEATAWQYADRFGGVIRGCQVINEPDAPAGSASSDTMSQAELIGYLGHVNAAFQAIPGVGLIGPGLSSGQPGWWNADLSQFVDALACHPYGKFPTDAAALLQQYYDAWGLPIFVTEFLDPGASMGLLPEYLAAFSALPFVQVSFNYGRSPAWGQGGGNVPAFTQGILRWVQEHPGVDCGQPLEDEFYYSAARSQQMTSTGMFFYSGGNTNAVQFVARPLA